MSLLTVENCIRQYIRFTMTMRGPDPDSTWTGSGARSSRNRRCCLPVRTPWIDISSLIRLVVGQIAKGRRHRVYRERYRPRY